jgi:hypothetical protein
MDKVIERYAEAYRRGLDARGFDDVDGMVAVYRARLREMYASDAYREHNVYPSMSVKHVYAVIAMCLELRERGLTNEQIIDTVNAGFAARRRFFDVLVRVIDLLPMSYRIAERWNVGDHAKRVADGSITYDSFEVGDGKVEYRISHCMYVEMFERYGIRCLCKIFCMTDERAYAGLARHVRFVRHSDLSDGDCCHDEIMDRRIFG